MNRPVQADHNASPPEMIRRGSPFAPASMAFPADIATPFAPEDAVAAASGWASMAVAPFAIAAVFWFPWGGMLVASLGGALAVGGLFGSRRTIAMFALVLHLALFYLCY